MAVGKVHRWVFQMVDSRGFALVYYLKMVSALAAGLVIWKAASTVSPKVCYLVQDLMMVSVSVLWLE